MYKDDEGKVQVTKHEKPTEHGVWTDGAVGALVGIMFPPAILGATLVGAAVGGGMGRAFGGVSRSDAEELAGHTRAPAANRAGTIYLNCPRCGLTMRPKQNWLTVEHCPRCIARRRVVVRLFASTLPADELYDDDDARPNSDCAGSSEA